MDYEIPPGKRGRVAALDPSSTRIAIQFSDGLTGTVTFPSPTTLAVGSTVVVWEDDQGRHQINELPDEFVVPSISIGIVKLVQDDSIVVEVDGRLRKVESRVAGINKGATVEIDEVCGITRELSSTPIRVIDFADESSRIEDFIVKPVDGEDPLTYDDFAGFPDLVEEARELIEISLDADARLSRVGGRPIKGLLFTGEPGSGKTLLARIISRQNGATFYQINGPAVMGRWVGQSEEVLRALFEHAAARRPAIIFFDEIDSLAARRDIDASESSQRVVAQLLTLMDGFHSTDRLLIIAATNRVDQIDPALRRPGRFDREIKFRRPGPADRLSILRHGVRHYTVAEEMPLEIVAERTDGWSSAEVAAIWNEAAFLAASDGRDSIRRDDLRGGYERQDRLRRARDQERL